MSLYKRMKQALCRHAGKRVWDIARVSADTFRVRIYCPRCGRRWDREQRVEDYVSNAAGDQEEMRDLLRKNLDLKASNEDAGPTGSG